MSKGRPRKTGGSIFSRPTSAFWWVRYRNRDGQIVKESAATTDEQEAERFLRRRLDARDDGQLPTVLAARNLTFGEWADWFLEVRSKPPFRTPGTHSQNLNAVGLLRPVFGVGSEEARLCAGLRPPLKLHGRFSRMQLSRRHLRRRRDEE
jgi:hypothetical protein